jgi:hypothetical protein
MYKNQVAKSKQDLNSNLRKESAKVEDMTLPHNEAKLM